MAIFNKRQKDWNKERTTDYKEESRFCLDSSLAVCNNAYAL